MSIQENMKTKGAPVLDLSAIPPQQKFPMSCADLEALVNGAPLASPWQPPAIPQKRLSRRKTTNRFVLFWRGLIAVLPR